MARTAAARRYAEAAFELASRDRSHDAWARDLEILAGVAEDERIRHVLDNPSISRPDRHKVLDDLVGARVGKPARNLAGLLVDRGRTDLLPAIAVQYRRLHNRARGIAEAEVTSAAPLSPDETEALRLQIQKMAGTTIDLTTRVDEALIGGLTVKVAGRLLDASVRGRLERLRSQLAAGVRTR